MIKFLKKIKLYLYNKIHNHKLKHQDYLIKKKSKKIAKKFGSFGENSTIVDPLDIWNPHLIFVGKNVDFLKQVRLIPVNKNQKIIFGNHIGPCYYLTVIAAADVIVEDNCSIAGNCFLCSSNHQMDPTLGVSYGSQSSFGKPIHIKNNVWLGQNVTVLSGVTIGEFSIIGAGSVVTKDIPAYSMAVGNPAKVIKKYNFETKQWETI